MIADEPRGRRCLLELMCGTEYLLLATDEAPSDACTRGDCKATAPEHRNMQVHHGSLHAWPPARWAQWSRKGGSTRARGDAELGVDSSIAAGSGSLRIASGPHCGPQVAPGCGGSCSSRAPQPEADVIPDISSGYL